MAKEFVVSLTFGTPEATIDDARKITDDPTQYDSFEYLYNVMRQRVQQEAVST